MEKLINLKSKYVSVFLEKLLKDKTTDKNIIWATSSYEEFGPEYKHSKQITIGTLSV